MRKRSLASQYGLVVLLCGWLARADVQSGLQWLASTTQTDGRFASANRLATPFQSTAESLRTFSAACGNGAAQTAAVQYAGNEPYHNTENLSRLIVAGSNAGQDVSALVAELVTHQDLGSG